jgi:hypothetical protein
MSNTFLQKYFIRYMPYFYSILYFSFFVNSFLSFFTKISKIIVPNVPAVCDVFAARIRALRSKVQGCKNVGAVRRGNEP